jgi:hypothetical protein
VHERSGSPYRCERASAGRDVVTGADRDRDGHGDALSRASSRLSEAGLVGYTGAAPGGVASLHA